MGAWGQKRGPKPAIFDCEKFSLLFFLAPINNQWHPQKRYVQLKKPPLILAMGSQHLSPSVKTLFSFKPQVLLEIITSCDAKSIVSNAPRHHVSGSGNSLTKFMPISFSGVYLVFELSQESELMGMLAISYLVLHACISFLRCFRQEWRTSVCDNFWHFWEDFGQQRWHHMMDAADG